MLRLCMDNRASLSANNESLSSHYDELVSQYGSDPKANQWRDQRSQNRRFEVLCNNLALSESSILDFGCGTGALYEFLKKSCSFTGKYTGIDLSSNAIEIAKSSHPEGSFHQLDVLVDELPQTYDYVLVSGTFNNEVNNHLGWVCANLESLFRKANVALVFNMLSNYVDYKDEGLYYSDPEEMFRFCKLELSPAVNLIHAESIYETLPPFEYVIQVFKTPHESRLKLS